MYKYIDEAKSPEEEKELITKAYVLNMMLTEADREQANKEYQEHRDSLDAQDKAFKPWYRWMIDRIEVKLR